MKAAVVRSFDHLPRYEESPDPVATGDHEIVVEVLAAGLHPRVRSGARGTHYTSAGELPLVPGVDAVGRLPDGGLVYFVALDGPAGTMAERALVDTRRAIELPADVDSVAIAAAMNQGMSSWVGLRRRAELAPGESVLVLGATGNAGRMAVQIAKRLGAAEVIAAGRNPEVLATLPAIVRAREDHSRALRWVQIGAITGPEIALPSAALRAANLKIMGSGQGSVTTAGIVEELPALAREIDAGSFPVDAEPIPLAAVESAWTAPVATGRRLVFVP
jgi:NADPH:quinone reductase-like Zn-dependent oxidoreductase